MKTKLLFFISVILFFLPFLPDCVRQAGGESAIGGRWFAPIGSCLYAQPVQQEWVATYTNPFGLNAGVSDMAIDTNGNTYLTGWILRPDSQGNNFMTIKYNSSGMQQWATQYNGPGLNSNDNAIAVVVDKQGNVYVTGRSEQTGLFTFAYCTVKYNSSGVQQWVARYKFNPNAAADGESPWAIAVDDFENVYVTGASFGFGTNLDYATIKYNSNGDSLWVRRYDGNGNNDKQDIAEALFVDKFGNVFVTGTSDGGPLPTNNRACTIKYNSSGIQQWVNYLNLDATSGCGSIKIDTITNDIYIGGGISGQITSYKDDYLLLKYNSSGVQQWMRIYAGYGYDGNYISDLSVDNLHNIYVTGQVVNPNPNFHYNYTTIKYNSVGDSLWIRNYDRSSSETTPSNLAIDKYNDAYITGLRWNGTNYEFVTLKYNSSGTQQWLMTYPGGGKRIKVDKYLNVYVTGGGVNTTDIRTIKYSQPDGIKQISNITPIKNELYQNYPNPFNPSTKIKFNIAPPFTKGAGLPAEASAQAGAMNITLKVYDILGREVASLIPPLWGGQEGLQSGTYEVEWNAAKYSSGVYFYQLIADGNIIDTKKLILLK